MAGHLGANRSTRTSSSAAMTIWRSRFCPAAASPGPETSTISCRSGWASSTPSAPRVGVCSERSDRRRLTDHARAAAGGSGGRLAQLNAVGPRSLHPVGLQRLLSAPGGGLSTAVSYSRNLALSPSPTSTGAGESAPSRNDSNVRWFRKPGQNRTTPPVSVHGPHHARRRPVDRGRAARCRADGFPSGDRRDRP